MREEEREGRREGITSAVERSANFMVQEFLFLKSTCCLLTSNFPTGKSSWKREGGHK